MNLKLSAVVLLLAVLIYYFGTGVILPSFVALVAFILSPFSNQQNYVSSVEARKAKPNQTAPYRKYKDRLISQPENITTLYENFKYGLKLSQNRPCLGTRVNGGDFVWETYEQVHEKILSFGSGLKELGIEPHDRVGFYAKNRSEWFIGAEACNAYSFVSVAIYDTLGEENREFIVKQSGIKAVLTTSNLVPYLNNLAATCTDLKHVIVMEKSVSREDVEASKAVGLNLTTFDDILKLGSENRHETSPPHPDDLAILMYTSGTTSRPKGVMITNRNVVAVVAGVADAVPFVNNTDSYLSYLPLAHILERAAEAYMISKGARIGFFQGDLRKLSDDIRALKPTVYAGVPKVFQRVMNEVKKQIHDKGIVAQLLFKVCFALKKKFRLVGLPTGIFDTLIFNKTKIGLGGNVRIIVSGGAPLPHECHEFLTMCFGTTVQGYGLTETCGGATLTPPDYYEPWDRAGTPLSCCEIKLVSSGKYSTASNPPQGELCVKGDNVSLGYYQMKQKTDEDFQVEEDGERWFHTGDVARRNPDGSFSIVGRVKDIFKLDSGEYIAPERLESIYAQCKLISNIFVWGNSFKSYIVGVVVPEYAAATRWANENGVDYDKSVHAPNVPKEICENEKFKKAVIADLKRIAIEAKLNRYEELPIIHVDGLFWTPDTGLVTDALKNKRDPLFARYQKEVEALYDENNIN